jgi:hypothetical protein
MQDIKIYVGAANSVGVLRDYVNARSVTAPPLVRDVDVMLKFRLFADNGTMEPYPIDQLLAVRSWKFVLDRDFDETTSCVLQGDNDQITVSSVTESIDGVEYQYSEIAVPISNTNTA